MCLSIPAKVIKIDGKIAEVSIGGSVFKAGLHMIENVEVGDYILLHTGFAIQKISDEQAKEMLKLIKEMDELRKE